MLPNPDPFKILLFSIFSLAARLSPYPHESGTPGYSTRESQSHAQHYPRQESSEEYFSQAKALIDRTYHLSHPTVCQSLLLLGIREVGMGSTTQAWLYFGMAIRMAQDLGMHRSVEKWTHQGRVLLTNDQIVLRQRIWYGCVKADRYFSMFLGRPMTIRDCDFDAYMPNPMSNEEMAVWKHHPRLAVAGPYSPVAGRFISCFNANVSLSVIVGYILEKLYPVRGNFAFAEANDLRIQLKRWLDNLSPHLRIQSFDGFLRVPPHLLNLHSEYCAAVILLNRPLLRVINPSDSHELASIVSEAWDQSITAAQTISDIVRAWCRNFPTRTAFPFMIFDIFHAALVWIAALTMRNLTWEYQENLELCLETLKEIETTYPLAGRCYQLLNGAKIPRIHQSHSSNQSLTRSAQSFSRGQSHHPPTLSQTQTLQNPPGSVPSSQAFASSSTNEPFQYSTDTSYTQDPQAIAYVNQLLLSSIPQATTHPNFLNGWHWSPEAELNGFNYDYDWGGNGTGTGFGFGTTAGDGTGTGAGVGPSAGGYNPVMSVDPQNTTTSPTIPHPSVIHITQPTPSSTTLSPSNPSVPTTSGPPSATFTPSGLLTHSPTQFTGSDGGVPSHPPSLERSSHSPFAPGPSPFEYNHNNTCNHQPP